MNPSEVIAAFSELLQQDLTTEAKQDLPQLAHALEQYPDEAFGPIADAIVAWCARYSYVAENLKLIAVRGTPGKSDPKDEEAIKTNISIIRDTIKEKTKESSNENSQ